MITKDDFEQWKHNPVTRAVLEVVTNVAETAKEEYKEAAWNGKHSDELLNSCRATYETAMIMNDWPFEAFSAESEEFEDVHANQAAQ